MHLTEQVTPVHEHSLNYECGCVQLSSVRGGNSSPSRAGTMYQCSCLSEQQVYKQVNRIPGGGFEVEGHKLRLCLICITFCGWLSSRYSSEAYGLPVVLCDSKGTPSLHEYLQGYCGVGMCMSSGCYVNEIHCLLKQPIGLWLTEGKYCIVTMGDQ